MSSSNTYEVEKIINKRVLLNYKKELINIQYLIKWKNYSSKHNSWAFPYQLECDFEINRFQNSILHSDFTCDIVVVDPKISWVDLEQVDPVDNHCANRNEDPEYKPHMSKKRKHTRQLKKKVQKDGPKKPLTSFFHYMKENRARLSQPGMSVTKVSKAAGAEWREIADKSKWNQLAMIDKIRYQLEMGRTPPRLQSPITPSISTASPVSNRPASSELGRNVDQARSPSPVSTLTPSSPPLSRESSMSINIDDSSIIQID